MHNVIIALILLYICRIHACYAPLTAIDIINTVCEYVIT